MLLFGKRNAPSLIFTFAKMVELLLPSEKFLIHMEFYELHFWYSQYCHSVLLLNICLYLYFKSKDSQCDETVSANIKLLFYIYII